MSYRFDSSQVNPGAYHWGFRGVGVKGSQIAHGGAYDGYMWPSISLPADANKEYQGYIPTIPAGMTNLQENSGFDYAGASTSFSFQFKENGVLLGTRTATVNVWPAGSVVTGVTVTPPTATIAAGGTQQFVGVVDGNGSPSQDMTWEVAGVAGATGGSISAGGLFTGPIAQSDRTFTITGKSSQNPSYSDTASITVLAEVTEGGGVTYATYISEIFESRAGVPWASLTGLRWYFHDQVYPAPLGEPVAQGTIETTNGSGVLLIDIAGLTTLTPGQVGWLVITNTDGNPDQAGLMSWASPVYVH